ncbi:hypothetical protein DFH06DRAFT_1236634 [Mycena polygramma]|nr:hypothetical protein DFH06DRAFT_1236634 [Mycena polygramma]
MCDAPRWSGKEGRDQCADTRTACPRCGAAERMVHRRCHSAEAVDRGWRAETNRAAVKRAGKPPRPLSVQSRTGKDRVDPKRAANTSDNCSGGTNRSPYTMEATGARREPERAAAGSAHCDGTWGALADRKELVYGAQISTGDASGLRWASRSIRGRRGAGRAGGAARLQSGITGELRGGSGSNSTRAIENGVSTDNSAG